MSGTHRTHLRYESADAFGALHHATPLTTLSPQPLPAPHSHLLCLPSLSTINVLDLNTNTLHAKLFHTNPSPYGTHRALNTDTISTLITPPTLPSDTATIAVGYTSGTIRIFTILTDDLPNTRVNSLLDDDVHTHHTPLPLSLTGHSAPITILVYDSPGTRLCSASTDAHITVWDTIAECGLLKLSGHVGPVTSLSFIPGWEAGLCSGGADGVVKVWDLDLQCSVRTLTEFRSEVNALTCFKVGGKKFGPTDEPTEPRIRILAGGNDVELRMWNVSLPTDADPADDAMTTETEATVTYTGSIHRLTAEPVSCVKIHNNKYTVGVSAVGGRSVEIYRMRSEEESGKRRNRRVKRRREKEGKIDSSAAANNNSKKKGLLDEEIDPAHDPAEQTNFDETNVDFDAVTTRDELLHYCTIRTASKVKGFVFVDAVEKGGGVRCAVALANGAVEVWRVPKFGDDGTVAEAKRVANIDMYGHANPIRGVAVSEDDTMCCCVGKGGLKIWNVESRSCVRSMDLESETNKAALYALCVAYIPKTHMVVVGTKEGALLLVDGASGDVLRSEKEAHEGAVWSIDVNQCRDADTDEIVTTVVSGSADGKVKFWIVEPEDEEDAPNFGTLTLAHTQTLEMKDDVVCVKYTYSPEADKTLVCVSSLDSTVKVFFADTLKFFLSLYGHKLPALALDAADDDSILVSGGADKTLKIWGLDFGDCHRSMHGHTDSVTALKFVRKTHNFFSASKDRSVRYWDADKFEQILLLDGHVGEIHTLAMSRSGGFVLSAGMDKQVRVWERTHDMVFIEEEREAELEKMFEKDVGKNSNNNIKVGSLAEGAEEDDENGNDGSFVPQSEAAARKTLMTVAAGDRIMEAIELADKETKDILSTQHANKGREANGLSPIPFRSNPMLLNMDPPKYMLWVLKSVKAAELEQALLVLPMMSVERLVQYLLVLLKRNMAVELCSKVAVFVVKTHKKAILANQGLSRPLRELKGVMRERLEAERDVIGYNLAAFGAIMREADERNASKNIEVGLSSSEIWGELGLGSDTAAKLSGNSNDNKKRKK